jgi:uncharacterized membrane protein HdeD (DUF308 family)
VWLLGLGVTSVVIGIVVLVWPSQTLRVVGVLFGIYLLISGVIEIMLAFAPGLRGGARFLSALTGGLSILLGLICFRGALESILLLALWIGFSWLIIGITRCGGRRVVPVRAPPRLADLRWHPPRDRRHRDHHGPLDSIFVLVLLAGIWLIAIGVWADRRSVYDPQARGPAARRPWATVYRGLDTVGLPRRPACGR